MNSTNEAQPNRSYKARLFELVFSEKTELLKLYNAMNKTDYKDPELLEINTLKNAIYMSMHNDVSFLIDSRLTLYEHQSTYSPNLPLRYLFYVSDLYSAEARNENLYGTKIIHIPAPRFVIFYNGEEEQPDSQILKLSDMYTVHDDIPILELEALMLNINPGHNQSLLNACKTLNDYSEYTAKVRSYAQIMSLNEAVEKAITECISNGILADFLRKNKTEAKNMSIYEYDQERHIRQEREAAKKEGVAEGIEEGIKEGTAKILKLSALLIDAGRTDDLKKAAENEEFCQKLCEEFHIS